MKVAKWGNSLAVRLPAEMVEALGLKEGDELQLTPVEGGMSVMRIADRIELLNEFREKYRGRRPKDYKFDRDEIHDRDRRNED